MIIQLKNICKSFGTHQVLKNVNFNVDESEFIVIKGCSGSGKSTLLNLIGLLDLPDSGIVNLFGESNVKPFSKKASMLLKNNIGYLFQNFALLEDKTVYYNLMLCIENHKMKNKAENIKIALQEVGLSGYEQKKVFECSGGEQQRIAIARLLLKPCRLILADEPTGSLDEKNKEYIFHILKTLQEKGVTIIVVSHDVSIFDYADRVVDISNISHLDD